MAHSRVNGLSSGLDTETIVRQLMDLERRPVQLLQQRRSQVEAVQNAWRDVRGRLAALRDRATVLTDLTTLNARSASVSDAKVLTASATADAISGAYRISVSKLAQAHSVATAAFASTQQLGADGDFRIETTAADGTVKSAIITVAPTDTLATLRDKIEAKVKSSVASEQIDVRVSLVTTSGSNQRLVITSNRTGLAGEIKFADVRNTPLTTLDIPTSMPAAPDGRTLVLAQNASLTVDGLAVERASNTITDVLPGVTLNLLNQSAGDVVLTVGDDTQKVVDAVRAFVDQYNSLQTFIKDKSAAASGNVPAGPLQGDATARQLRSTLRSQLLNPVYGLDVTSLAEIGISYGKFGGPDADRLIVDETKLRDALTNQKAAVSALFGGGTAEGVFDRLADYAETYLNASGVLDNRDKAITSELSRLDKSIRAGEDRLALREEGLRRQFKALETILGRLQTQQTWLQSQLAKLT